MKKADALKHMQIMMVAIQRIRSVITEGDQKFAEDNPKIAELLKGINEEMFPYVFGKKCPLQVLAKIADTEFLEPNTYSNMIYIALNLEYVIGAVASMISDGEFPSEWSLDMVRKFEE